MRLPFPALTILLFWAFPASAGVAPVNLSDARDPYAQFIGIGAGLSHATALNNRIIKLWDAEFDTLRLHTLNLGCFSYEIMDDHIGLGADFALGYYDQHTDSLLFAPILVFYGNAYLSEEKDDVFFNPFVTAGFEAFPLLTPFFGVGCRFNLISNLSLKLTGMKGFSLSATELQACYRFGLY